MRLTEGEREAVALIEGNGGYACLSYEYNGNYWYTARFEEQRGYYVVSGKMLSRRVLNKMRDKKLLRRAPGHGYGSKSFYEIVKS